MNYSIFSQTFIPLPPYFGYASYFDYYTYFMETQVLYILGVPSMPCF
ncbi:hypothetical protein [Acinetobacter phage Ab69]|nr:hypothetical protein [Acinetobacter phage Ab69]